MHSPQHRLVKCVALALAVLLLSVAALVPVSALEPYGNNIRIRNWVNNDPAYTFSEQYITSVWYRNFPQQCPAHRALPARLP